MQHVDIDIKFNQFDPFPEFVYDLTLATDPNKADDLARFVRTYYIQNHEAIEDFDESWKKYQGMINESIKSGNLNALETLWQGIYFHDRDNPDYETDVYTAVEFGNLKMLQHVLYGYMNYSTLNGKEDLKFAKLKELAAKNPHPDVLRFIESLVCCVNTENKIGVLSKYSLEDEDEDEDEDEEFKQILALSKKFYDNVENFAGIAVI